MIKLAVLSNYRDIDNEYNDVTLSRIELDNFFKKQGIEIRKVNINFFNPKKNTFSEYVVLDKTGKHKCIKKNFRPKIIWNKSRDGNLYTNTIFSRLKVQVFPSQEMVTIASDKYEMYLFLRKYQPQTCLLRDFFLQKNVQKKFGNTVILKPIRGNSGKGILKFTKKQLLENEEKFDGQGSIYIVQNFHNFSKGIPGICTGMHDLRLIFVGNKIIVGTLRQPKKGNYRSNVGLGGSEKLLKLQEVPKKVLDMGKKIITSLPLNNQNIGSIDFGYVKDTDTWYVFEVNFSPGLYVASESKEDRKYFSQQYFGALGDYIHNL